MKSHTIFRIILLIITVAAFAVSPFLVEYLHGRSQSPQIAQSSLPIVGQIFSIAGQEDATEPGIVLRAKTDADIGELIRLDASESDVDGLTWQIIPATDDFEVIEGGRRAFFSSRFPGAYLIIVAAAKDGVPYLTHHTIDVIGTIPDQGSLSSQVRGWTRAVEAYPGRDAHGKALAGVFRKLSTADDVSVDQILEATATANSAVLGSDLEKWLPLLDPLGTALDELSSSGGLTTRDQYRAVWQQIATGIERGV